MDSRMRTLGLALALALLSSPPTAAASKTVLIIRGEAPDLPGNTIVTEGIISAVRKDLGEPVEFYVETIDTGRFASAEYEQKLVDLLAVKYSSVPLDLVVAFSQPAVDFVLRERSRLFPAPPLLLGHIDSRLLNEGDVPGAVSVVNVQVDAAGTVRLALTTASAATRVLVVGGTSRFDRAWMRIVREDLRDFDPRVTIAYDTESRLADLLGKVSALPSDTIVLYVSMTRDGANVSTRPPDVARMLSEASSVPVYGLSTTYLGQGIVGGVLLDHPRHATDLGRRAVRMLRGEIPEPITTPGLPAVDWRRLQRFGMSPLNLSPSTVIAFRERSLWERERGFILITVFVVAAQSGMIVLLIWLARRRREAQRLLGSRLQFEKLISDLSLTLASASAQDIDGALEAGLARIAVGSGVEHVWRWEPAAEDTGWESASLQAGQPAVFDRLSELPPTVRDRLQQNGCDTCAAVAMPLISKGTAHGALFWLSRGPVSSWRVRPDDLSMLTTIVANVLQRRQAESALEQSDRLKGAILDSLPAHVAVVDRDATIIAVNELWTEFARASGAEPNAAVGTGVNYLSVCDAGANAGAPGALEARALLEGACRGEATRSHIEYRCDTPDDDRWYSMTVAPLRRKEGGAVVTHSDITERKKSEIALRESEDRFRRMADALPVAIWMSEADGLCSYFNSRWLELTGRPLETQLGNGWLDAVHPDDRVECTDAYLSAFGARRRLTIEYRVGRPNGEYRWVLDVGVPRYGPDGAFHGYVGGCVDITERLEAERLLRDLNRHLLVAQEDERRRVARELHDHLHQQLALLAIHLQQLSMNAPESREALVDALQDLWRHTGEIASDVHAISHRLHPSKLEALGLVATVRAHCRDISREGVTVNFEEQPVSRDIDNDVALCLYRVLEEALNNVRQHSGAGEARVSLSEAESDLVLRVSDQGRGFVVDDRRRDGLGLVSMRERLESVGGTLMVQSAPGQGTVVEARVPRDVHGRRPESPPSALTRQRKRATVTATPPGTGTSARR
jgi:PAS domain S-box-containing protein